MPENRDALSDQDDWDGDLPPLQVDRVTVTNRYVHEDTHAAVVAELASLRADIVRAIQTQEKLRSRLRRATRDMQDARAQLTVGMKAGVADARKILAEGIESARSIDDERVAESGEHSLTDCRIDPKAAGRRAVAKHGEALKRLSDQERLSGETSLPCECGQPSLEPGPLHHCVCPKRETNAPKET